MSLNLAHAGLDADCGAESAWCLLISGLNLVHILVLKLIFMG